MMSVALQNRLLLKAVQAHYGTALPLPLPIVTLCNYTLLLATVKVLETFLEAILCKPFQLFRCILNDVSSFTKATSPQGRPSPLWRCFTFTFTFTYSHLVQLYTAVSHCKGVGNIPGSHFV